MLIGLSGKKQSGKSTIAKYLVEECGFIEYSIASPLKQVAKILCGFTEKQVNGSQQDKEEIDKTLGISPREFLQVFGTEICRDLIPKYFPNIKLGKSNTIWVYLLSKFIQKHKDKHIVVSDVRFIDEFNEIKDNGGTVIEIQRNLLDNDLFTKHASETQNIQCDYTIENNSTIPVLLEQVLDIIDEF